MAEKHRQGHRTRFKIGVDNCFITVYIEYIQYRRQVLLMNIILLNTANEPIYQQIKNQMIEQILNGQLKEGERLPSIRRLAGELKISVITTKRAYEDLEQDGYIDTVPGKGTFVSHQDKERLRARRLLTVREQLKALVIECQRYHVSQEELLQWIRKWYGED